MEPQQLGALVQYGIESGPFATPLPTPELTNRFANSANKLFGQAKTPILFLEGQPKGYQYSRFSIAEKKGTQIVMTVTGELKNGDIEPIEITIRLWNREAKKLKKVKLRRHSVLNTVNEDACDELEVNGETINKLNSPQTLDVDSNSSWSPVAYSSSFINEVVDATEGAQVNQNLCEQAVEDIRTKKHYQILEGNK